MLNFLKNKVKPQTHPSHLGNLIEILQDGVCITNLSGDVLYLNKAGYALLGISKETDLNQLNFFDNFIYNKDQIEQFKNEINQKGLVKNRELELKKLDGGFLDVILTINMIGDYRQQTIGFLFLFKDVTELKKIQQQLLQSQKLESIGLMASGIAHDFNNILAAIIPNAELIKYSTPETDENYRRAEIIEKSAQRATEIAQRLLTFTRQNDLQHKRPVDLNKVVEDSIEMLEHSIPQNVRVLKQLTPSLNRILADEAEIQQIIMNLVINAVDAMPNGGQIEIQSINYQIESFYQIGNLDPGDYVRLRIKDSGTGIPVENLSKIFDPFFTTKEVGKGTGLGLSVVYGIVKSMNGYIEVKSELGKGTRFDIYFPAIEEKTEEKLERVEQQTSEKQLTFLIVDDEEYVLNILGDILDFLGYRPIKVSSGSEALSYFKEHWQEIDYVIVDLKMPKMDGRATFRALKEINPDAKIIFTSGFDDSPMSEEEISGSLGLLKKPYSINQVAKSLESFFSKS